MQDELNYSRICTGQNYTYSVCEDGRVIKTSRKHYAESHVAVWLKRGKAAVKINNKEYILKNLVAQHFITDYKKGDTVITIDGNPFNCNKRNLQVISKAEAGRQSGYLSMSKPVIADGIRYKSIRECAKAHYVSYQTLLDYINGKVKHSILQGLNIKYEGDYI